MKRGLACSWNSYGKFMLFKDFEDASRRLWTRNNGGFQIATHRVFFGGLIEIHLSLERLLSTVALLSLALAIAPQLFGAQSATNQQSYDSMAELFSDLLRIWELDLIVISLSVDDVSLSLSTVPFLLIFPTALMICVGDAQAFAKVVCFAFLTIVFVFARFLANTM